MRMDKIPNQKGYLVLTMDGAVIASSGDLENNERVADIISKSICSINNPYDSDNQFKTMTIVYPNFHYSVCVSNKKIFVTKVKHDPSCLENDDIRVLSK